jgi:N,N'-diacetyllegionaminate synthase
MTKIIAEAGINHGGDFQKAKAYIDGAVYAGADYVKFHLTVADDMKNLEIIRPLWNDNHPVLSEPIDAYVKKVEFSIEQMSELRLYASKVGINFLLSCYGMNAIATAINNDFKEIKLASCDFTRIDYIEYLNENASKIMLATGMVDEEEFRGMEKYIDVSKTSIFHCISLYPTPYPLHNLSYISELKSYGYDVGYSDHTKGIEIPIISLSFGPSYIEKHFMLDQDKYCADEKVSCSVEELKKLCTISSQYSEIIGSGKKKLTNEEINNRRKFRNRW